ncbi:MAG TPA: hypothetical protein VJ852_10515 [Gemmatimonadaceae bacterium]|nr:hypothetical protein [Gemmatimonadaceae bacterium]
MWSFLGIVILVGAAIYLLRQRESRDTQVLSHASLTEDQIKQGWRKLGFFCEIDTDKKVWTLTGSKAGLLYFPDLLLGYVNDPQNAADGSRQHYDPYGSLEIMTYPDAGFDSHAIRGSLPALTHLAELVEQRLVLAEPGEQIKIREDFAPGSPFALLLDVRPDGFDPAAADKERLGATSERRVPRPEGGSSTG